jgi:hypothetical protein
VRLMQFFPLCFAGLFGCNEGMFSYPYFSPYFSPLPVIGADVKFLSGDLQVNGLKYTLCKSTNLPYQTTVMKFVLHT